MGVRNKELAKDIDKLKSKLQVLQAEVFDIKKSDSYIDVVFEHNRLRTVSTDVQKDETLSELLKTVKKRLNDYLDKEIKKLSNKKSYKEIINLVAIALQMDINNISYAEYVMDEFLAQELYIECIEMYKTMFLYSPKPEYFEKMGDVYLKSNNIESAIDAYLNSVEISDDSLRVYQKLAGLFEKVGDSASRDICLAQINNIKGENDK